MDTDGDSDHLEVGSRKTKRQRRSLKGQDKPTNLSHYKGEEKDVLNLTKENLKVKICVHDAFPDISTCCKVIQETYEEAAEQLDIPKGSELGPLSRGQLLRPKEY